jgi:tetratricopeptide (TPR) repeat protein
MNATLDLHIKKDEGKGFLLEMFERDDANPLGKFRFDYDLSFLTEFEVSQLEAVRNNPDERMNRIKTFGRKLYQKIFTEDVEKVWNEYKDKSDFLTLCVRISRDAERLEILPWETLFDGEEFIASGVKTSLSRLPLDIKPKTNFPDLSLPVKMLSLLSSPVDLKDHERLLIEEEQKILLCATNASSGEGKLLVEFEDEAKALVIEDRLEEGFQILHYTGHGISAENGGGLVLEYDEGKKRPTTIADFLHTLEKGARDLRVIVLSGCFTAQTSNAPGFRDLARSLARKNIPAVIAMQFSILDESGILFAETFYTKLLEGRSPDMAMAAARRAILLSDNFHIKPDAFAPVLFLSCKEPLKTGPEEKKISTTPKKIDFSFFVPLPKLAYGFYGRRKEYRALRDNLVIKNTRAAIVHGIGGIGKIALITHTANRLKKSFRGIYAFDCRRAALAPETILLDLHRFLEKMNIPNLGVLLNQSFTPVELATYISQVLSEVPLLLIFDNFETHLTSKNGKHEIAEQNLKEFLNTLVQTTAENTRFIFTSRHLFEIGEKRCGAILTLPLNDLSKTEALGMMQNLSHIAKASFENKEKAIDTFGGHPYAMVVLDRHCAKKSLEEVLKDAKEVKAELREFIAIEMSYQKLEGRARTLLNRLSAFRKPVEIEALHWVMGETVEQNIEDSEIFSRLKFPEGINESEKRNLLKRLEEVLPEKRIARDIDKPLGELIEWGLIAPIEIDGEIGEYFVHCLVRDFCKEKIGEKIWRENLENAAKYYRKKAGIPFGDNKSVNIVFEEIEGFELLCESGDFEEAAKILFDNTPFLDRWGFGRWLESLYNRILNKVKRETVVIVIHNMGILKQGRGEYKEALGFYEKSLKILEELGDRAGIASSLGQMGQLFRQLKRFPESLDCTLNALQICKELQSPNVNIAINALNELREQWGTEKFDKSFKEKTGIEWESLSGFITP